MITELEARRIAKLGNVKNVDWSVAMARNISKDILHGNAFVEQLGSPQIKVNQKFWKNMKEKHLKLSINKF